MYCPQCGALSSSDAKFCFKCGHSLALIEQREEADSSRAVSAPGVCQPRKTAPHSIWLYIVALAAIGTISSAIIPALSGKINPVGNFSAMFWAGVFFYVWWKRRFRPGWKGFLFGMFLVGGAINVTAHLLARYVQTAAIPVHETYAENSEGEGLNGREYIQKTREMPFVVPNAPTSQQMTDDSKQNEGMSIPITPDQIISTVPANENARGRADVSTPPTNGITRTILEPSEKDYLAAQEEAAKIGLSSLMMLAVEKWQRENDAVAKTIFIRLLTDDNVDRTLKQATLSSYIMGGYVPQYLRDKYLVHVP